MFDHDEMRRLRFYEALRFAISFAACMIIIAILAAWCGGCTTGPDGGIYIDKTVWVYVTNRVDSATGASVEVGDSSGVAESSSSPVVETGVAETEPVSMNFRYGGFKAKNPQEVAGCQIGSLKVGSDKMTYKWIKGGCEALGAKDKGDYSQTVACAFYEDGGRWVGGKFDWISTSRTSRSFDNIKSGYNGWDAAAFFGAKRHGFCIVSKDGKRRSNFIED